MGNATILTSRYGAVAIERDCPEVMFRRRWSGGTGEWARYAIAQTSSWDDANRLGTVLLLLADESGAVIDTVYSDAVRVLGFAPEEPMDALSHAGIVRPGSHFKDVQRATCIVLDENGMEWRSRILGARLGAQPLEDRARDQVQYDNETLSVSV